MERSLTPEELTILDEVVKEYLTELRMEISDTDDYDYRQGLKKKEETLRSILAKVDKWKISILN